jgi:hypothetical protein
MKYFKINPQQNVIIYRPEGELSAADIISYIQEVIADKDFEQGMLEYIDLSAVKDWQMDHQDVEKVTYFDFDGINSIKKTERCAIFAPSEIAYGMARMYQNLAEKYNNNIFISRDEKAALAYLNLNSSDVTI